MISGSRKRWKRVALVLAALAGCAVLAAGGGALWIGSRFRASLPVLEGRRELPGLAAPVLVERDGLGIPTIRGNNRGDVARATGFVHAQDRFFQMDLLRRKAAGELSALFGAIAVPADRDLRVHRFRTRAQEVIAGLAAPTRALLEAYVDGVNAGLAALGSAPPEYWVLRAEPAPWRLEDTVLVIYAMYLELQGDDGRREAGLARLAECIPEPLFRFLAPRGTEWDAPLIGGLLDPAPLPGPEVLDLRDAPRASGAPPVSGRSLAREALDLRSGSNNWAVSGSRTADGGALVANDMHLPLAIPNVWYRASFAWGARRVTGATLPGTPVMVVGSNGAIAWGFTNSQVDVSDLVRLETVSGDGDRYRTPDGALEIRRDVERIDVLRGEPVDLEVRSTIWGPIVEPEPGGPRYALRWVAHETDAVDMSLFELESARTVDEALDVAHRAGIPMQNLVVADSSGRIAWTLIGRLPRRVGFDGRLPQSWGDGTKAWNGWREPGEYPVVADPADGLLWTANNRVAGGAALDLVGDGGYALASRARQIRDGLREVEQATPEAMLAIQLDDRALMLERWRERVLETLDAAALAEQPWRARFRELVERSWTGHASIDSVGYRLVRAVRVQTAELAFAAITSRCDGEGEPLDYLRLAQWEGPLWALLEARPEHLVDPRYASWRELLLDAIGRVHEELERRYEGDLGERTWGERNTLAMRHPLSAAVPGLERWLDVPAQPLPGDGSMPRVQSPTFGSSQRMVVSPGREEQGIFHMPGGQSGHPLSPYYRAGHEAWAAGRALPFLPGPAEHRLELAPG